MAVTGIRSCAPNPTCKNLGGGRFLVVQQRGNVWQMPASLGQQKFSEIKAAGLEALPANPRRQMPWSAECADRLPNWRQIVVLSVESSRTPR